MKIEIVNVSTEPNWFRGGRPRYWSKDGQYQKTTMFFYPVGETIADNFIGGRFTRPYEVLRKLVPESLAIAAQKEPDTFNITGEQRVKTYWSQRAGCTCPCSPGFFLTNVFSRKNIFVDYRVVEE